MESEPQVSSMAAAQLRAADDAVEVALAATMPEAAPRMEFLEGSNLDIYFKRPEFEQIPFPDRAAVVEKVGKAWCDRVEYSFFPVVQFRDVKTGEVFGKYRCVTGGVTVEEKR